MTSDINWCQIFARIKLYYALKFCGSKISFFYFFFICLFKHFYPYILKVVQYPFCCFLNSTLTACMLFFPKFAFISISVSMAEILMQQYLFFMNELYEMCCVILSLSYRLYNVSSRYTQSFQFHSYRPPAELSNIPIFSLSNFTNFHSSTLNHIQFSATLKFASLRSNFHSYLLRKLHLPIIFCQKQSF